MIVLKCTTLERFFSGCKNHRELSWSKLHLKGLEKLFMLHLLLFGRRPCRGQWPMVLSHIDISPFSFFFFFFFSTLPLKTSQHLRISPSFFEALRIFLEAQTTPSEIVATPFNIPPHASRSSHTLWDPHYPFWTTPSPINGPHFPSPCPSVAPSSNINIVLIILVVVFEQWALERVLRASEGVMRPQRM